MNLPRLRGAPAVSFSLELGAAYGLIVDDTLQKCRSVSSARDWGKTNYPTYPPAT
jgi:hypothetical protein